MPRATVVGAGVIGLVTAHALEEAGFDCRVIAAAKTDQTTSWAAGAVWFPFKADPPHLVNKLAARTRRWLMDLAPRHPEAGVDVLRLYECSGNADRPWWADAVEDELEPVTVGPYAEMAPRVWTFLAPRVEPSLFLPWVESRLRARIEIHRLVSLDDAPGDLVINCTGLASRTLAADTALIAMFGQTTVVPQDGINPSVSISDERNRTNFFYCIPRRREIILGGVAHPVPPDDPALPSPAIRAGILARAREHGIVPSRVLRDVAGLRPYRHNVRIERDGRVIHHYGHGGSGYTLCRGGAEAVLALCR